MGHHINAAGEFQSDKHPDLPPDRIRLSFARAESARALRMLAIDYRAVDEELSDDIDARLDALGAPQLGLPPGSNTTPSEALYLFMGWLTTRAGTAGPFGAAHGAAQAADLVDVYCVEQGWAPPREGWGKTPE